MARIDIHRPSVIEPADYEYVAQEYTRVEDLGSAEFLRAERETIHAHMNQTGGTYSQHEHGGNCHVCGSVNAVYTVLFYHKLTNTYIRTGQDCADKLYRDYDGTAFRRNCQNALAAKAGKAKALAYLTEAGIEAAWDVYLIPGEDLPLEKNGYEIAFEERTIRDIIGRLIRYGAISEKQEAFVQTLLERIGNRAKVEAERAAVAEAAAPIPAEYDGERVEVEGTVLGLRHNEHWGNTQMLIAHDDGWKLWGTVADALYDGDVELKGQLVAFTAKIKVSDDDPKFGFFSRPTKAARVARKE